MLRAPVALRRFLLCLSISTSVHCVQLSAGIYRNQGPIEGLGKLRAIELAVRDAETQNKMEARLTTSGSFPDYDLVSTMSDFFELNSLWDTYSLYGPQFIHSRNCLNFAGQGRTKDSRFVTTIVSMYYQLGIPLQKRVAMSRSVTLCFVEGKWIAHMVRESVRGTRRANLLKAVPLEYSKFNASNETEPNSSSNLERPNKRESKYSGDEQLDPTKAWYSCEERPERRRCLRGYFADCHRPEAIRTHSHYRFLAANGVRQQRSFHEVHISRCQILVSHDDEGPPSKRLKALDQ
ncbi:hypothetical protein FOZ60_004092 [Perkinsus olseni]|uniref:Uncharacterized protein n=1 Tax=Perkinsus olseni TaxID=32597 RepID=A0A7J6PHJ0_PEROL|nr:hypothetical protein FOZ60_004092 [Perkinsus olseni]